jgi:hypothetical protein
VFTAVVRSARTVRIRSLAVSILVGLAVLLVAPGQAYAGPNEGDFFAAANAARAANGLSAYAYAGDLSYAARAQAERMAASGTLAHNPNLGGSVSNWQEVGENVGVGPTWSSIQQALMNSPSHRAAILDSGYTQMGVGTAVDQDGNLWVAEVFRLPVGATAPSTSSGSSAGSPAATSSSSNGTYSSTSSSATAVASPTPTQVLRGKIRDARSKVVPHGRSTRAAAPDPLRAALNFSTVMSTVG